MTTQEASPVFAGVICGDMTGPIRRFREFALHSDSHDCGVYYFGIIASACCFESVLEEFTVLWCQRQRAESDDFRTRLMDLIANDVSRATGLDAWKKWMRTLFDIDLVRVLDSEWEPLTVLFKLRNQLAHGRTTKFTHFWRQDGRFLGMTLKGSSYEEPFTYLIEKNVISLGPGDTPTANSILTRSVAAHFCEVVDRSIEKLRQIPGLSSLG